MSLTLFLDPGVVPDGTPLPSSAQALIDMIAQYTGIDGAEGFSGMNYGASTPSPENRQYPWFKTDTSGNPIGLYSWNGSAWTQIPSTVATGPTGSRPVSPGDGTKYFDTSINVELIFYSGSWHTTDGSPGDIKFCAAPTEAYALTQNPGWVICTAAAGRVLMGSGSGSGLTAREPLNFVGEENHVLSLTEMPAHTHTTDLANANADGNDYNLDQGLSGHNPPGLAGFSSPQSSSTGGDQGHNNIQPSLILVCIQKS